MQLWSKYSAQDVTNRAKEWEKKRKKTSIQEQRMFFEVIILALG